MNGWMELGIKVVWKLERQYRMRMGEAEFKACYIAIWWEEDGGESENVKRSRWLSYLKCG